MIFPRIRFARSFEGEGIVIRGGLVAVGVSVDPTILLKLDCFGGTDGEERRREVDFASFRILTLKFILENPIFTIDNFHWGKKQRGSKAS